MTGWREELEALDRQYADQRIPIEEYRRRRDDLLARAAVSPGTERRAVANWRSANPAAVPPPAEPPAPPQSPPTPSTQSAAPPQSRQPSAPQSPPESPAESPPAASPPSPPESPSVSSPAAPAPESPPPPKAPPATAPRPTAAPGPNGDRPAIDSAVRIAPPSPPSPTGQEIFARARPSHRRLPVGPLVLGLVALLALAALAWWLLARPGPTAGSPSPQAAQHRAETLPALPGTPVTGLTMAVGTGVDLGLYRAADAAALRRDGVAGVDYRSSRSGATTYVAILAPTTGDALAAAGARDLTAAHLAAGQTSVDRGPLPASVTVTKAATAYTAVYSSRNAVVVVTVSGDSPTLVGDFRAMVNTVLRTLPAG